MGRRTRPKALRLNEKLRQIRLAYGLSQAEMVSRLGLTKELNPSDISAFERVPPDRWSREPALPHLLRYARVAGVTIEVLIDPKLELPYKLAPDPMHGVVQRSSPAKTATKSKKNKRSPRKKTQSQG